jgi:cellulose synthase (UDP-forming)
MQVIRTDPDKPYAPIPTIFRPTKISLGNFFQSRPLLVQIVAILAIFAGISYFSFRLIITKEGVGGLTFWPLFFAEFFGYLTFLMLVYEAWRIEPTPRPKPLEVAVDVVITTFDEDIEIVEPTLIGALAIRGNTTIYLSDDLNRPEMKLLAERYGVNYQTRTSLEGAKAGNINAILPRLTGELLLSLDADHVPAPDFLDATSGYFVEDSIALIQTAHSFRNHNSVMHEEEGRHEQSLFFDLLLPGRNRLGSVFWCGSAALMRLEALRAIGGMSTRSVTEDFETSLELQRRKFKIRYHNEHLVQGLAPDTLEAYLIQRYRWARGTLSAFNPRVRLPWRRELSLKQKVSYTGALLYYLTPIQRVIYVANIIMVGVFGVIPMTYGGARHLWVWGFWVFASLIAVTALNRGTSQPFEGTRNMFLSLEVFLKAIPNLFIDRPVPFQVTPKNQIDLGGYKSLYLIKVPLAFASITALILIVRWLEWLFSIQIPVLPPLGIQVLFIITVFGLLEVVLIFGFARALWKRRQDRALWRFPVQLPAKVNQHQSTCIDLHQCGAGFFVPKEAVSNQTFIPISIELRELNGQIVHATGTLEIRNRREVANQSNLIRVGGIITWDTPVSRAKVIEHCYVVEPYLARNRQWVRQSPRARVDLVGKLDGQLAQIIDVSVAGAALITSSNSQVLNQTYQLLVQLSDQGQIVGFFQVRNITSLEDGTYRLGGSVEWSEMGWLSDYLSLAFASKPSKKPIFVISPF